MTDANADSLGQSLVFRGRLPLAWRELGALPSESERVALAHANVDTLRALAVVEAHAVEPGDAAAEPVAQDIARVEFKLNLLLDLMSQLLVSQGMVPEPRALSLTPTALHWQDDRKPAEGALLRIEFYCNPRYPRPLILHGQVNALCAQPEGWAIDTVFHEIGTSVQEGLERFIFAHHRRAVAQNRRRQRP
ncbi:MAG: PilZ domain-containing protein [Gammaproteobacteria bacterium]